MGVFGERLLLEPAGGSIKEMSFRIASGGQKGLSRHRTAEWSPQKKQQDCLPNPVSVLACCAPSLEFASLYGAGQYSRYSTAQDMTGQDATRRDGGPW